MERVEIVIFDPDLFDVLREEIRTGKHEEIFLQSEEIKIVDNPSEIKKYIDRLLVVLVHISWLPGGVRWIKLNLLNKKVDLRVVIYTGAGFYDKLPERCELWDRKFISELLQLNSPQEWVEYIKKRIGKGN